MVSIPQSFLLTLGAHGNMGDGELPSLMRIWAQRECQRLGLSKELKDLQAERIRDLQKRLTNVLGKDAVTMIEATVNEAIDKLKS